MLDFQGFRKSLGVGVVPGDSSKVRSYLLGAQLRSSWETLEELERLVFQTEPKAVSAETAPGVLDLLTKTEELKPQNTGEKGRDGSFRRHPAPMFRAAFFLSK